MLMRNRDSLHLATSLDDAVSALAERGGEGAALAGATWIMRAPIRQESMARSHVALAGIEELRRIAILDDHISIGACVTHDALAATLASVPGYAALQQAAAHSANPAVRRVATVGGNLCAGAFAAADLVPALLCLEAETELATPGGAFRVPLAEFLTMRDSLEPGCLLSRIIVPSSHVRSAHVRLPLRKAGDYPVAIVSLAADIDGAGVIRSLRIAVGSVEPVARRWSELEESLVGYRLDPPAIGEHAQSCLDVFAGRDGVEAPSWYRVKVLPSLVRRATQALASPTQTH